jgi:competence ComEA-like helix-hairpin-helix protein
MPFSRADGRALIFWGSLALLISGILLISKAVPPRYLPTTESEDTVSPIWLNLASAGELASLPGIGPVIAERIVRYRLLHGPFRSLDELAKVPGIGPQTLKAIQDRVRFDCPASIC